MEREPDSVKLPGTAEPFSIQLPPDIAALRDKALALHLEGPRQCVELPLIDARSWAAHTPDEDWLIWRARCCAERLRGMPLELEPGERLVGKPSLRIPSEEDWRRMNDARKTLASVPPFPGGDAGHFHPDHEKLLRVGIGGILEEIDSRRQAPGTTDEQQTFYAACRIAMEGLSDYVMRTAEACEAMAERGRCDTALWREVAVVCRRVATEPPATFHEALQLMYFAIMALWLCEDHGLTNPGRMDQTLRRFYEGDLVAGRITPREAFELISSLYIALNRICWPGAAIAVIVGGRDADGRTVANDLSYLCLAARLATKLVYPTVGLAWNEDTPDELVDFGVEMLGTGIGDPAFFNDDLIAEGLREHGVAEADCHNYMNSTCVEIKVAGASNVWVTAPYFNCPLGLLEIMADVAAGGRREPETFEHLVQLVRDNLADKVRRAAKQEDRTWHERKERGGFPLASCLINDCLASGRDYDRGGARYNWVENSFVGLANLVDSLLAVKHLVYDEHGRSLAEFHQILKADFQGHEELRRRIMNTLPKYGNDDDRADVLAQEWTEFLIAATESNTVGPHRYVPGFFCWVMHEHMGSQTGATPDGRRAGWPLADGAGAAQGRERRGPTASVLSTTKWCHRKVLGGLVHNAKFSKRLFETARDRKAIRNVIETYLRRGGFEIQINVVGADVLRDAQARPDRYPDLLVRVAGYSDYFTHLNRNMQDEIIARTEFTDV